MREILFRGKIKGIIDWVYGYYAKSGENHFILLDTKSEDNFSIVDENTVGQYTGLTDKNDKKIFEGDIVKDKFGRTMQIKYNNYRYRLMFYLVNFKLKWTDNFICADFEDWTESSIEVIGNIYDNPELLED